MRKIVNHPSIFVHSFLKHKCKMPSELVEEMEALSEFKKYTQVQPELRAVKESGKLTVLREFLLQFDSEKKGNKLLIFSQTKKILLMVTEILSELGIDSLRMDGDIPLKQRMTLINEFN